LPRQRTQESAGLLTIGRLAEDPASERHSGVRGQNRKAHQPALLQPRPSGLRLDTRNAYGVIGRRFAGERRLIEIGRALCALAQQQHLEAHADLLQQLAPSRAARCQIDMAVVWIHSDAQAR
jgi:hypothetical protein